MDVLIVGAGAMGRWFGEVVGEEGRVAFVDREAEAAREAADAVGGRAIPEETAERFDIVCLAVPIPAVERVIELYAPLADRALADVSGVMGAPIEAMEAVAPEREHVSLHPLFAPENAPGNVPVVAGGGPVAEWIEERLREAGNALVATTPEEHDRAMETVQTKAHTAVLAYALAADAVPEGFETPVSRELDGLVRTVTGGNPRVYADIQSAFPGSADVAEAAIDVAEADRTEFESLYREAGE
ncbi:prephenate dehydrogenase [Halalkalicoccus jeotgali]|uniref:Prephenate dehydrogenase n=1 Tax=Halalkalicoccus jeotgali (strain DSM 18796 / CECT 7217 / JCM 14584 / KCTC 4019 / B3) TaxID=795797 RepID=D8J2N9_HALJB|nr:prephenate dehydrogenase [Halalkalicoccus jeotgali]ADJ14996.1 prephenate dehydrogenase [Halalkalicoccus jeotgali B3]ELY34988.1 prephenate dehydrogenase [Halalkalicoccus jeotgali B3]